MKNYSIDWKEIKPEPDPVHGFPSARSSHSLTVTKNGYLYLIGGENEPRTPLSSSQFMWSIKLNDTLKYAWKLVNYKGDISNRLAHAAAYCSSLGTIFLFGGRVGVDEKETALNDLWSFDIQTECWSLVSSSNPPPEARSFHKMICVDNKLYLFGGCGAKSGRLADLHVFDISSKKWEDLGSSLLRGRGGANFEHFPNNHKLAVIAGFAGEETCDGQLFDLAKNKWQEEKLVNLESQLRPRSVCVSNVFRDVVFIFGGEVDPSDKGHDGAGSFEKDLVCINQEGNVLQRFLPSEKKSWPESRGWSDGASTECGFWMFGGLAGNDAQPKRLQDLWYCAIEA